MNYNSLSLLSIIEEWGGYNNLLCSEEQVSKAFDHEIAPLVVEQYGEYDSCAIHKAFSDWIDDLYLDGELHEKQRMQYTYVGKYSVG